MISFIDVINSLDNNKMPIGHGLKMLKEWPELLGQDVEILASREYVRELGKGRAVLPFCHYQDCKHQNIKMLCNYFISLLAAKGDIVIYTNITAPVLWGIAICKGKKKVIVITYLDWNGIIKKMHGHSIRNFLIKRGIARLDGCISTNYLYKPKIPYTYIPDYFITEKIAKYQNEKKRNGCICLGEIRDDKDVEGLVKVIRKTEIPLLIAGSFRNRKTYQRVSRLQTNNIEIEDGNLPYDSYLAYLSMYKYLILPYDIKRYDGRTSGVLLEGVILGAVPIAPKSLLEQTGVQGLAYSNLSDIPRLITLYERGNITVENDLDSYQFENCKNKLKGFISQVQKSEKK